MTKIINNAEDIIIETISEFCGAVCSTLGPGGKNVIISTGEVVPHVTKDGVTVSESIHYADPAKEAIISLIKESARKTASTVGDGTTTSTLLVKALVISGMSALKQVSSRKVFMDALENTLDDVKEYLEDMKVMIDKDSELLKSVISISSNSDAEVTKLVSEAVKHAGADGIINVEATDEIISEVITTKGASLDTRVLTSATGEYTTSNIVLIEGAIKEVFEIEAILQYAARTGTPIVIIAKEFSESVIKVVNVNNGRGKLQIVLAEAEGFSTFRMEILKDLGFLTGADIISTDGSTSHSLKGFNADNVGTVEKVIFNKHELILFPFEDKYTEEVDKLTESLKATYNEVKLDPNSARASHIKRRLSKYATVATIRVGGVTEGEVKEKKDRVDDAVCAVSAAVNGGVLPGGGMALYNAGQFLKNSKLKPDMNPDEGKAINVIIHACSAPISTLCSNAGIDWSIYCANEQLMQSENNVLDINELVIGDAFALGIIDPALVPINAILNAASVTKTLLKSKVIIIPDID